MLNTIKLLKSHKPLLLLYYLRNDRTCQFTSGVHEKQSHPKAAELHSINTQTHLLSVHLWHIEFLLTNSEVMKHKRKHETKVGNESINDGPVCESSIKVMSDLMFIVTDFDLECEKVHGKHS